MADLASRGETGIIPLALSEADLDDDVREAVRELATGASILAIAEAVHGAEEPLIFRNQVVRYAVEQLGVRVLALESGLIAGAAVQRWIEGGPGSLRRAAAEGLSWDFDQLMANLDLISWIQRFNSAGPRADWVRFYGIDITLDRAPQDERAPLRTTSDGLCTIVSWLEQTDPKAAARVRDLLDPHLGMLGFHFGSDARLRDYRSLDGAQRMQMTNALAELDDALSRAGPALISLKGERDYGWARHCVTAAQQLERCLRNLPPADAPLDARSDGYARFCDDRDQAMADNVAWILEREGPDARMVLFASAYHLSSAPLRPEVGRQRIVAGTHLRRRMGSRYRAIGSSILAGNAQCGAYKAAFTAAEDDLVRLAAQVEHPAFLVDSRGAAAHANLKECIISTDTDYRVPAAAFDAYAVIRVAAPAIQAKTLT